MTTSMPLQALQGDVLRLRGVVDRFGTFEDRGRLIHTLCVRDLVHAATGQPIEPDHWWFRLRQAWSEAGVQPGDTVLFTAKVRCCSKGHHNPELVGVTTVRGRERVVGLAGEIRELMVKRRGPAERHEWNALQEELRRERLLREQAESDALRLITHRDAMLRENERLRGQVALWRNRCPRKEISSSAAVPARANPHGRRCRGFAALVAVA